MSESPEYTWLREHYNEVAKKYPNEWVAIDAKEGVVAHNADSGKIMDIHTKRKVMFAFIEPSTGGPIIRQ